MTRLPSWSWRIALYAIGNCACFWLLGRLAAFCDRLDPILDACVATYNSTLDENGQVNFKGKAKAFVRTYEFLASVLPYSNAG